MQHRHLNHDRLTPAAVDDIVQRGKLADWKRLALALRRDSSGALWRVVRQVCAARRHDLYAPSQSFAFWICYLNTHRQ